MALNSTSALPQMVSQSSVTIPRSRASRLPAPERSKFDIELKVSGLEEIVLEVLGEHPPQKGFVVSSFLPEPLVALRSLDAELPVGLICETTPQYREWHNLPVQFVIPHHTLIDINIIQELHEAGRRVLAWTVNLEERMLQLRDRGVDGIISDRTDLLGKLRE